MKGYLKGSLEKSSNSSYMNAFDRFSEFMEYVLELPTMPSEPKHIALYVTHLRRRFNLRASTIRTHLSALAFYHKVNGYADPTESFLVKKLVKCFDKLDPPISTRKPIQKNVLHSMLSGLKRLSFSSYEVVMLQALFSFMYEAALRSSEVVKCKNTDHTLQICHVKVYHSFCLVSFPSYKHNKKPDTKLKITQTHGKFCTFELMKLYLKRRGNVKGPLFIKENGASLSRSYVANRLSSVLTSIGHHAKRYNTHSFRKGKASDMACEGHSNVQIALLGRWNSSAYKVYTKPKYVNTS